MTPTDPPVYVFIDADAIKQVPHPVSPQRILDFATVEGTVRQCVLFADTLTDQRFRKPWRDIGSFVMDVTRQAVPGHRNGISIMREYVTAFIRTFTEWVSGSDAIIILVAGDARYQPFITELAQRKIRVSVFLTSPDLDSEELRAQTWSTRPLYMSSHQAAIRRIHEATMRSASITDIVSAEDLVAAIDTVPDMEVEDFLAWYADVYLRTDDEYLRVILEYIDDPGIMAAAQLLHLLSMQPMLRADIQMLGAGTEGGANVRLKALQALVKQGFVAHDERNGFYTLAITPEGNPVLSVEEIHRLVGFLSEE